MDKQNKHNGAHVIKLKNIQTSQNIYMTTHQFQVRSTTIYLLTQSKAQLNQIINYTKVAVAALGYILWGVSKKMYFGYKK